MALSKIKSNSLTNNVTYSFANTTMILGDANSTTGSYAMGVQYSDGQIATYGAHHSSGAAAIGYGVRVATGPTYISTTPITIARAVYEFSHQGLKVKTTGSTTTSNAVGSTVSTGLFNTIMDTDAYGNVNFPKKCYAAWSNTNSSAANRVPNLISDAGGYLSLLSNQGTGTGSIYKFTAPVAGRYLVTIECSNFGVQPSGTTNNSLALMAMYGSWTGSSNTISPSEEIIDVRQQFGLNSYNYIPDNFSWSAIMNLAAGDWISPDWYQGANSYTSAGTWEVAVALIS